LRSLPAATPEPIGPGWLKQLSPRRFSDKTCPRNTILFMGLDINSVQLLIAARKQGAQFDRTIMLGRAILNVFPQTMVAVLERHGLAAEKFKTAGPECAYAELFF
jgi:hypothetical protein